MRGQDWASLVQNDWWHETLRLYAAKGDATAIVQACLRVNTVASLSLIADCLEEACELEGSLREQATDWLVAGLESSDAAHRRLAAEVQLSRRLKSLQAIDEKRSIDLEYITCAEYQLFVDDMYEQGKFHQPDHWIEPRFPAGQLSLTHKWAEVRQIKGS